MILIICLLFTSISQIAKAQTTDFGLKGGYNASTMIYNSNTKSSFLSGANVGMFITTKINEKFSIQPEFLYSQEGNKTFYSNNNYEWENKNRENFFLLPILVKYHGRMPIDLLAGPQLNISNTKLGLDLGAEYSLTDHLQTGTRLNVDFSNDEFGRRNMAIQIYISYRGLNISRLFEPM